MVDQPRTGGLRRGWRLGKLGLSLTGSYLGYQVQNLVLGQNEQRDERFQRRSAKRVREELGALKGAVMKLGQLLSLQTQALPETVTRELAGLQMHAPAMHPTLARAQFKNALGRFPEDVFHHFEPEPFAAASLGQVHRAVTKAGERVVVKIQYPAIRAAIENDFELLRSATTPVRLTGHLPQAVLDEVQRGFLEETDYLHEARNLEFFSEGLAELEYVTVPKVFKSLSAERVLTMSFVEGEPVEQFLARRPTAAVRNRIGDHLLELYYFQLHRLHAIHADHHPGNYLFTPDGRISLVDFGCVKRIRFEVATIVRGCIARCWREGEKQAKEVLDVVFGPNVPYARAKRMIPALEIVAGIWFPERPVGKPVVDCGRGDLMAALTNAMRKSLRDKVANPEFAFVSRAELGLYSLLHRLQAKINPRAVWERVEGLSSLARSPRFCPRHCADSDRRK